jgi:hypothetical protein
MQAEQQTTTAEEIIRCSGRWVTERTYAQVHGLTKGTLSNWRFRDRLAGRNEAAPGFPWYRHFGRAVRYWLPAEGACPEDNG